MQNQSYSPAIQETTQPKHQGYFGIAVVQPKCEANFGGILRNAHAFGASFVALIGARYVRQPTDTSKASRHLPVFVYRDVDHFLDSRPFDCEIVRVEVNGAKALGEFTHHQRAIYLFGGEDRTVPETVGERSIVIPTRFCLNLATTTGIVMYDRTAKGVRP